MKRQLGALGVIFLLLGCINAGDHDVLPLRKKIVESFRGYALETKKEKEEFLGSKVQREYEVVLNKALTVKKGEPILSDKTYQRDSYRSFVYRPTKKGTIDTKVFPVQFDPKKEYDVLGWVTIDGKSYGVLATELDDYVVLFDDSGVFYNKAGRLNDGRVNLLDDDIFIYPSDMRMLTLARMRDDISNVKNGYEVKYGGVQLDRIWFDYMDYDSQYNEAGMFERLNFPNKPGLIMINGVGLRILRADDNALTYMILSDESR